MRDQPDEARKLQQHAAWDLLALDAAAKGDFAAALPLLSRALAARPGDPRLWHNAGTIHERRGDRAEAFAAYARALSLKPDYFPPANNLAELAAPLGRLAEAIELLRAAPSLPGVLGGLLMAAGKAGEAAELLRAALDAPQAPPSAVSDYLLCLNYLDNADEASVAAEHHRLGARLAGPTPPLPPRRQDDARLRLGYVSGDFRRHSVAFFIEPILHFHDRARFDLHCYADVPRPDFVTERLRSMPGIAWRDVHALDLDDAAALIARDQLDLLIDLGGHTARLAPLFFRRLAPIQASYLGYPNTSGSPHMDFRLTDRLADPPGNEAFHSERLTRLDGCFLAFAPPADAPEPSPPRGGPITFGSFNAMPKLNERLLGLWAEILAQTGDSRLLLKNAALGDAALRQEVKAFFAARGVAPERIEPLGFIPSLASHLEAYNQVDLALDSFPYNGTTTTCEALWMGVPTLTLTGVPHRSRVGLSLLSSLGLDWLAVPDAPSYKALAVELAGQPERLAELRRSLRGTMAASPLCDCQGLTAKLERAYRSMWRAARRGDRPE